MSYVPFLTAKYDEAATAEARRVAGGTNVAPRYQWLYRPEMQFSLFMLDMQQVNLTNSDGSQRNVLEQQGPSSLYSADSLLRTLYRLEAPKAPALSDIDGAQRKLVLAPGGKFVDAAASEECRDSQPCLSSSAELSILEAKKAASAHDFLALRLLQKGDEANVLWEYGFADIRIYITSESGSRRRIFQSAQTVRRARSLQPPNPEQLARVEWTIPAKDDGVSIDIGRTTGKIHVPAESEEGFVTIEARVDDLFRRVKVYVGCECETCKRGCMLRVGPECSCSTLLRASVRVQLVIAWIALVARPYACTLHRAKRDSGSVYALDRDVDSRVS